MARTLTEPAGAPAQQGGWRSGSVLLRVYARWLPQPGTAARLDGLLGPGEQLAAPPAHPPTKRGLLGVLYPRVCLGCGGWI